jgi:hypothetical protein
MAEDGSPRSTPRGPAHTGIRLAALPRAVGPGSGRPLLTSGAVTGRRLMALSALALLAAGLVLLTTRDGVTMSPDSAVYVGTARSVASGHGLDVPIHFYPLGQVSIGTPPVGRSSPLPTPLIIYAPLAPILLAVGGHPIEAARIEDTIFFGLTILLIGLLVVAVTDRLRLAAIAQLLIGFSLAVMIADVGTLATTLCFTVGALVALIRHLANPRYVWLILASVAVGLATLDRFSAGPLIVFGVIALRHRRRDALVFFVLSSLPLVSWFLYEATSGRSTGHFLGFHIETQTIRTGIQSVSAWVVPSNIPTKLALPVAVVIAVIVLWLLFRHPGPVPALLLLFIVVQIVFLEVAITFFDAGVNLDPYEFIPIFVAVVLIAVCSMTDDRWLTVFTVALVAASIVHGGVQEISHPVSGYADQNWRHSAIIKDVRALPAGTIIYTDAPDALYLLADRTTSSVPETVDFSTLKPNVHFQQQLGQIRHTLLTRGGVVVYVRGVGRDSFLPTEAYLRRSLGLTLVRNARDGAIYKISSPS